MICKNCGHNTKEDYWKEEPIKTSGRRSWTNKKRNKNDL